MHAALIRLIISAVNLSNSTDIPPVKPVLWVNSAYFWFFCAFIDLDCYAIMQFKYNNAWTKKEQP